MDILQVLEGATYLAFIVGAIVAVYELRAFKNDRRIELQTRMMEQGTTRELMEPLVKIWRTKSTSAEELEKEVSPVSLYMVGEYWSIVANMATQGLIRPSDLIQYFDYVDFWKNVSPWVLRERKATDAPDMWDDIETLAGMQQEYWNRKTKTKT